jgi:saccharopine dehydrogenase-like NADP-dependent oxidoreductase
MNILVLGSGLMGPAVAYNALQDPAVQRVTLADLSFGQLEAAQTKLARLPGFERLSL